MSALTLLSFPASAVPGPQQGSSGGRASGFLALLAAETGEGSGAPDATRGAIPDPEKDDAPTVAPDAPDVLPAAVVTPPPLALTTSVSNDATLLPGPAGDAEGASPEVSDGRDIASEPPSSSGEFPGALPALAGQTPSAGANEPQGQPGAANDSAPRPPPGETPANMAGAAILKEAALAEARTGAAPVVAPPPMPGPAPLRPPAERLSRPMETPVGGTGDPPRDGETAPTKAAAPAASLAMTTSPAVAREPATVAPAASPSPDGAPAEMAPSGEGRSADADTPSVARETALSQLSRVTVEATAQIAAQILRRLEGRSTRFEMALTPDELGRVDVKLDIDSEGRLNARLAFDNPAAATDLRGRADELRRQLEEAGFHLDEDALQFAERDSGSSAFDRGQDARDGQSRAFTAAARLNAEIDVAQPPGWMALSLSPAGVDMKV